MKHMQNPAEVEQLQLKDINILTVVIHHFMQHLFHILVWGKVKKKKKKKSLRGEEWWNMEAIILIIILNLF